MKSTLFDLVFVVGLATIGYFVLGMISIVINEIRKDLAK